MKKSTSVIAILLLVLILDQAFKIWVKTHMEYGDEIEMFGLSWALIHFVENNGMAFGLTISGDYGKLALSLFRILAVGFLVYYIRYLLRLGASMGLLVSFTLILAGALGNIFDSAFYGLIFSASPFHGGLAELFPAEGGYATFLHGKVVDMLYFPVLSGKFPEWFPIWGGETYLFFKPVFNLADLSITMGVINILLFQRSFFSSHPVEPVTPAGDEAPLSEQQQTEPTAPNGITKAAEGEDALMENDEKRLPDPEEEKDL